MKYTLRKKGYEVADISLPFLLFDGDPGSDNYWVPQGGAFQAEAICEGPDGVKSVPNHVEFELAKGSTPSSPDNGIYESIK